MFFKGKKACIQFATLQFGHSRELINISVAILDNLVSSNIQIQIKAAMCAVYV